MVGNTLNLKWHTVSSMINLISVILPSRSGNLMIVKWWPMRRPWWPPYPLIRMGTDLNFGKFNNFTNLFEMNDNSEPPSKMTRVLMLLILVVNVCRYWDDPPVFANVVLTDWLPIIVSDDGFDEDDDCDVPTDDDDDDDGVVLWLVRQRNVMWFPLHLWQM